MFADCVCMSKWTTCAQETYLKLGVVPPGYQVMEVDFSKDPK